MSKLLHVILVCLTVLAGATKGHAAITEIPTSAIPLTFLTENLLLVNLDKQLAELNLATGQFRPYNMPIIGNTCFDGPRKALFMSESSPTRVFIAANFTTNQTAHMPLGRGEWFAYNPYDCTSSKLTNTTETSCATPLYTCIGSAGRDALKTATESHRLEDNVMREYPDALPAYAGSLWMSRARANVTAMIFRKPDGTEVRYTKPVEYMKYFADTYYGVTRRADFASRQSYLFHYDAKSETLTQLTLNWDTGAVATTVQPKGPWAHEDAKKPNGIAFWPQGRDSNLQRTFYVANTRIFALIYGSGYQPATRGIYVLNGANWQQLYQGEAKPDKQLHLTISQSGCTLAWHTTKGLLTSAKLHTLNICKP